MMHRVVVLTAILAAGVLGLEAPIPGYGVEDFVWNVDPFNNGTIIQVSGTVQDVHAAILKVNPAFVLNTTKSHGNTVSKRHEPGEEFFFCGPPLQDWEQISAVVAASALDYLYGISGQPGAGPGPGNCGRVSCDWAGIWWCNDNTHAITLPSFATIADAGHKVIDYCNYWVPGVPPNVEYVLGQRFDPDGWNVIVRGDHHCKD